MKKEKVKKFCVHLPEEEHRIFKSLCASYGISMRNALVRMIKGFNEKGSKEKAKKYARGNPNTGGP